MDTDKMDSREFAEWCDTEFSLDVSGLASRVASRDAFRERQDRERVIDRIVAGGMICGPAMRAAILGTPGLVEGQLVWWAGTLATYRKNTIDPDRCVPLKAHIDDAGRVIED